MSEFNKFEKEFMFFCRRKCTVNCDAMPIGSTPRSKIIMRNCPIIRWEMHLCDENDIEENIEERLRKMTNSGHWLASGPQI